MLILPANRNLIKNPPAQTPNKMVAGFRFGIGQSFPYLDICRRNNVSFHPATFTSAGHRRLPASPDLFYIFFLFLRGMVSFLALEIEMDPVAPALLLPAD